jgi:hypothetical protein
MPPGLEYLRSVPSEKNKVLALPRKKEYPMERGFSVSQVPMGVKGVERGGDEAGTRLLLCEISSLCAVLALI